MLTHRVADGKVGAAPSPYLKGREMSRKPPKRARAQAEGDAVASRGRGRPRGRPEEGGDRHLQPRIVFHLPQEVLDLLNERAAEARRSRSAEILLALEGHYRRLGVWPDCPRTRGTHHD